MSKESCATHDEKWLDDLVSLHEQGNGWNPVEYPGRANAAERAFRDKLVAEWPRIMKLLQAPRSETVASKDPLIEQRHEKQVEYSIHLQRIIEALCHGNTVPEACFAVATHHAEMAKEFTDAAKAHASVSAIKPWDGTERRRFP